jgi:hypothetical protein
LEVVVAHLNLQPQHLPGGTEENHENPQTGQLVYRLNFKPDTSKNKAEAEKHVAVDYIYFVYPQDFLLMVTL